MASESTEAKVARHNKQPNITFTLPMSCQICLGKVKQPVLCPNFHVFCQLCLDIWLERNNQCPACRVQIGPSNPIKHIIGGQLVEESQKCQSTPDLRRARLDLLYREYEDQMEGLRKENLVLRTENDILSAQLKEADVEIEKYKSGQGQRSSMEEDGEGGPGASSASSGRGGRQQDGPSLLQLTKNLKEAQKLYSEIKDEMSKLRRENGKLKDENVNLTRENDNLRLEIAQRSPKKFGRFTVATLETKLSELEKEVRQLTSALERSDSYIEELELEIKALSKVNKELKDAQAAQNPGGKFPVSATAAGMSASSSSSSLLSLLSRHDENGGHKGMGAGHKKFPFHLDKGGQEPGKSILSSRSVGNELARGGGEVHGDVSAPTTKRVLFAADAGGGSNSEMRGSEPRNGFTSAGGLSSGDGTTKAKRGLFGKPVKSYEGNNDLSEQRKKSLFAGEGEDNTGARGLESQNGFASELHAPQNGTRGKKMLFGKPVASDDVDSQVVGEGKEKPAKRVHFSVSGEASGEAPSFDLEMPSPYEGSSSSSHTQRINDPGFSFPPMQTSSGEKPRGAATQDISEATSEFDRHIVNLLQKANAVPKTNFRQTEGEERSLSGDQSSHVSVRSVDDSSHLSGPDDDDRRSNSRATTTSTRQGARRESDASRHLEGEGHVKQEFGDLDVSMTPELNDCLRLMDRAEKNMQGVPRALGSNSTSLTASSGFALSSSSSGVVGASGQTGNPPGVDAIGNGGYSHSLKPVSNLRIPSSTRHKASAVVAGHGEGFSSSGTVAMWQQEFYSSLRTNPYKMSGSSNVPPFTRYGSHSGGGGGSHESFSTQEKFPLSSSSHGDYNDSIPASYGDFKQTFLSSSVRNGSTSHSSSSSHPNFTSHTAATSVHLPSSVAASSSSSHPSSTLGAHYHPHVSSSAMSMTNQEPAPYESYQPSSAIGSLSTVRSADIPSLSRRYRNKSQDSSDLEWPDGVSNIKSNFPVDVSDIKTEVLDPEFPDHSMSDIRPEWPDVSNIKTEWPDEVDGSPPSTARSLNDSFTVPAPLSSSSSKGKIGLKKKKARGILKKGIGGAGKVNKPKKKVAVKSMVTDDSYLSEPGSARSGSGSGDLSDFLAEPKRRLSDIEDDFDLDISPNKTTRR
ncbi:uncharacterized protein LOC101860129 [Aplysia californica]|uniref:Uncharacterized protein LOC101860129 n=1 Tax=Aplysia californica TaxID=6500 RepID=A0ABM0K5Q9_APLCA|nr:uncharacterized protein LOC101860129 [Aplysia californica]